MPCGLAGVESASAPRSERLVWFLSNSAEQEVGSQFSPFMTWKGPFLLVLRVCLRSPVMVGS